MSTSKTILSLREMAVFAMLGAVMFVSKIVMEGLPNIHLLSVLTIIYTIAYRGKAIIPVMVGMLLLGMFYGFASWWVPYLYIWPILWFVCLLVPKKLNMKYAIIVYTILCSLHGLAYGSLYSIFWGLISKYTFEQTLTWISTGFYFDILMAIGNLFLSILIFPLSQLLIKLSKKIGIYNEYK